MKTGKSRLDILLNALSLLLLTGVPAWLAATWGSIPEEIPQHYIASGAADRFGPKSGLITLQVIPWAAYILFTAVQFLPRSLWNTGFAETEEERGQVCALTVHLRSRRGLLPLGGPRAPGRRSWDAPLLAGENHPGGEKR